MEENTTQHHGAQQYQGLGDVVFVVFQRICNGFAHLNEGGKVYHCVKLAVDEQRVYNGGVAEVALDEFYFFINNGSGVSVYHAVQHGDVCPGFYELAHGVRTDVATSSGNEYFHVNFRLTGLKMV